MKAPVPELELGVDVMQMPDGTFMLRSELKQAANDGYLPQRDMDATPPMPPQVRNLYRVLLSAALALPGPTACRNDARFTADTRTPADAAELRRICDSCQIQPQCRVYAAQARPEAGFWAGRDYSEHPRDAARMKGARP